MAKPDVRVLETNAMRTVLRVDFPVEAFPADWQAVDPDQIRWALPRVPDDRRPDGRQANRLLPPRLRLSLAVPTRQEVTWRISNLQWWREPAADFSPDELVTFAVPAVSRSVPITGAELPLSVAGGILRSLTIEVTHLPHGPHRKYLQLAERNADKAGNDGWRADLPAEILNPVLYRQLTTGSRLAALETADQRSQKAQVPDLFDLTGNWVKLYLTETGMYRVTGQDLSRYGVSTTRVDPAKLRLYRGGGLPLSADPELPDSLQTASIGLNEVAIQVLDGDDGEWNLDDAIRFYGVGTSTWLDRLDPAGERLEHFDHPYADEAVYWLTWEDELNESPLPGPAQRIARVAAAPTGGVRQTTARLRLHREDQAVDAAGLVQDNWVWDNTISSSRPEIFMLRPPVPATSTRFQIDFRAVFGNLSSAHEAAAAAWLNADQASRVETVFTKLSQNDSLRVRLVGQTAAALPGTNSITLQNISTMSPRVHLALDSYDVLYWTDLVLADSLGQLSFAHWADQVAVPGTPVDLVLTVPADEVPLMWDVSNPHRPEILSGLPAAGSSRAYGTVRDPQTDRHFVAALATDMISPLRGARATPRSLRTAELDVDYLVISASAFLISGLDLAAFRSTLLPGVSSPAAKAVTVDDVYDNYAGGQKDPRAIRNFLKSVYDRYAHRLKYVCLLGNASRDYRNYRGHTPLVDLYDLVSTEVRTSFPSYPVPLTSWAAYASDDGLVSFDSTPAGELDLPDLACGRLPAVSVSEAREMVARAITFGEDPEPGLWRNDVLFTADDVMQNSTPRYFDRAHTLQAEYLAGNLLPISIDLNKIYEVDYKFPPGSLVKPAVWSAINSALNSGTTIFYYVGHGSEDNLSDEQIFKSTDIPNLTNGMKRPVFVAFSCDVGVFDSPNLRSMAERFLQYESGGAIGAICASQVSYISANNSISNAFFAEIFPDRHVTNQIPVSAALRLGKSLMTSTWNRSNSQRYNFFGDPGTALPIPRDDLQFAAASVDTLRTGARQAAALAPAATVVGAGDTYFLRVEESATDRDITEETADLLSSFIAAGSPVFAGSGTLTSDPLSIPFKVPLQLKYGSAGRVRLLVETPDGYHTAAALIPAVRSAATPNNDLAGPAISLAFTDNQYRVRPGEPLVAALHDTSGIAMLGTNPGNSLLLEFDDNGIMTDVTDFFVYDADSYTTGRVTFALPRDLPTGRHLAALYASDALGNVGSDTLSFEIGEVGQATIGTVTLYPNPTPGYCRLLFELGDPMDMQWDVYTVAGSHLRTIRASLGAGPQVMEWDGRDSRNDEIANGMYIFVLRGTGATTDGREIRRTGKLVIMR